jgi:hypothetical protein
MKGYLLKWRNPEGMQVPEKRNYVAFFLRYIPGTNALIFRDSRRVPMQEVLQWCRNSGAAMITVIFFQVWLMREITSENMADGYMSANLKAGGLHKNRIGDPSR